MFVYSKRLILIVFILSPLLAKRARKLKINDQPNFLLLKELSAKRELNGYLTSLENIIGFCINHNCIDVNLAFGLFLINVHLKTILKDENKYNGLPKSLHDQLENIVFKNDQIMKKFKKVVMEKQVSNEDPELEIATMFLNESKWMKRLPKFNTNLVNKNLLRYSHINKKSNWKSYSRSALHPDEWIPSPHESDKCMASLARSPIKRIGKLTQCRISLACKNMILNGTNFGYAFTHRLLILQSAYFARGCRIFSDQLDMGIRNSICATAYLEAEYISMNNYGIVDLMLEIIGLCALDGHARFLRSAWLRDIQRFQTPLGCFSEIAVTKKREQAERSPKTLELVYDTRSGKYDVEWKIFEENNNLLNRTCNGHVTAVAATSLSAAVRFIIETYY